MEPDSFVRSVAGLARYGPAAVLAFVARRQITVEDAELRAGGVVAIPSAVKARLASCLATKADVEEATRLAVLGAFPERGPPHKPKPGTRTTAA